MNDFDAKQISTLAWAYARAGRLDREPLRTALVQQVNERCISRSFSAQSLANVAWSFAKPEHNAARCEDAVCRNAVIACNAADSQLYETYERRFDAEIARRDGDEQFRANRRAVVAAPARNAPPFASKYPINCQQPNTGPPERRRWKLLNSCGGRVD